MARTCIIVADRARARFLTLETAAAGASAEGSPHLVEHRDLVNPDADIPERELFSDRSSRAHASPTGAAHALDDHREQHTHEADRRYARRLLEEAQRFVADEGAALLLLVCEPRLLGTLREQRHHEHLRGIELREIGEDLTRRPLDQIQSNLASRGAVPAATVPEGEVFHPRGQPPLGR